MILLNSSRSNIKRRETRGQSVVLFFIVGIFGFLFGVTTLVYWTSDMQNNHPAFVSPHSITHAATIEGLVWGHSNKRVKHNRLRGEAQIDSITLDPNWTPAGPGRYPEYKDGTNIFTPTPDIIRQSDQTARSRRKIIQNAMKHAWNGYKTYAWGQDELLPVSKSGNDAYGGMGATLIDALDTLWLMNMKKEFWEARDWVRDHLSYDHLHQKVSLFETTIRNLGGLLSAYDLSGDEMFLEKAEDLGRRLGNGFKINSNGFPADEIYLDSGQASSSRRTGYIAEAGSVQIEFRHLAKETGYETKSERVYEALRDIQSVNKGLFAIGINLNRPTEISHSKIAFGARGDSFYEYMLKIWIQGGKKEQMFRDMYDYAMDGLHEQLLLKTSFDGLTYIPEKMSGGYNHQMDHLACFMGGTLALGAYTHPKGLHSPKAQRDLKTAKALTYTCYQMYAGSATGLGPEIIHFKGGNEMEWKKKNLDNQYILRPEVIESLFYLNKLTGDPIYREWGWEIFQAIETNCKTDIAYGGLEAVNTPGSGPTNRMESFFLAETLKYLYLLFDPDSEIDILNKHVLNTEAHPMRRFDILEAES